MQRKACQWLYLARTRAPRSRLRNINISTNDAQTLQWPCSETIHVVRGSAAHHRARPRCATQNPAHRQLPLLLQMHPKTHGLHRVLGVFRPVRLSGVRQIKSLGLPHCTCMHYIHRHYSVSSHLSVNAAKHHCTNTSWLTLSHKLRRHVPTWSPHQTSTSAEPPSKSMQGRASAVR